MTYKGRCRDGPIKGEYIKNDSPCMKVIKPVLESFIYREPQFGQKTLGEYWFNGTEWRWYPDGHGLHLRH